MKRGAAEIDSDGSDSSPAAVTLTEESKEEAGDDDAPSPKRTRPKESGFKRGFLNAPPSEKKKKPPPADDS